MKIRLMTFNIQHCMSYQCWLKDKKEVIDFDLFANAIKAQNADIVVLNEVRDDGGHPAYTEQAKILAEKAGFKYYRFGEAIKFSGTLPYGNAMLSKYPIDKYDVIKIPDPPVKDEDAYYETRCVMRAKIAVGDKNIVVFGSHFGLANSEKRNAVSTIVELLDKCDLPQALMGDFNMQPDNEKLKPIFDRLTDTEVYFKEPKFSFPSDKPECKIDYIFVSKDIKVLGADIIDNVVSDHRPAIADVEL